MRSDVPASKRGVAEKIKEELMVTEDEIDAAKSIVDRLYAVANLESSPSRSVVRAMLEAAARVRFEDEKLRARLAYERMHAQ